MKRVLLVFGLVIGAVILPQHVSARPDLTTTTKALPTFKYRPLVFERYPLDLSAFDDSATDDLGPFDIDHFDDFRPIVWAFGEDRQGNLSPEMNHTYYGLDTSTPVYAGISGTVHVMQNNPNGECDSEILISPDSPVFPLSFSLYFDHIIPSQWLLDAFAGYNPVHVDPDDIIGTVGIRNEGGCSTDNPGWLEIAVIQNYEYAWNQNAYPEQYAAFCPTLFLPSSTSAPAMPQRPALTASARTTLWPFVKKPDTKAPKLTARQPANGKRGVSKNLQSITFSFNERVTITKRDDARVFLTRIVPGQLNVTSVSGLSDDIKLSNKGKKVTVDISSMNLENGAMYSVKISDFLFRDASGNAFQGVNGLGDWTFIVGPTTTEPATTVFTAIRSTVENQIRNIMRKYNRLATEIPSYAAYPDVQINLTHANCITDSFSDTVVQLSQ